MIVASKKKVIVTTVFIVLAIILNIGCFVSYRITRAKLNADIKRYDTIEIECHKNLAGVVSILKDVNSDRVFLIKDNKVEETKLDNRYDNYPMISLSAYLKEDNTSPISVKLKDTIGKLNASGYTTYEVATYPNRAVIWLQKDESLVVKKVVLNNSVEVFSINKATNVDKVRW